jgi:anhydro-N-acetylmuramic acid kinase
MLPLILFKLFCVDKCSVDYVCHMNFVLGELFASAAIELVRDAGYSLDQIDLIGSHGQTIYHIPVPRKYKGYEIRSTLQVGEPAVIAERTGIVTVADFRVRDIAAGGQGAPLVPYSEFLLYREENKCVGLQNIGGIANVTVLPRGCTIDDVYAFDNGPGNMIIDEVVKRITNGEKRYDSNGEIASRGCVNHGLLEMLMADEYFRKEPPKTTGREYFGREYVDCLMRKAAGLNVNDEDLVSTVTALTAAAIGTSLRNFVMPKVGLDKFIIGGGGSYNRALVNMIREQLPGVEVLTQEDIGLNSDAKEAVAFAVLANEAVNGNCNNVPRATGANKGVIMGKIII